MTTASTEMMVRPQQDDALLAMPLLTIEQMIQRRTAIVEITKKLLKRDHDYGPIPGMEPKANADGSPSNKRDVLLKPGAEKLCTLFGLVPEFEDYRVTEDWEKGLFYYAFRCNLTRNGRTVASGIGSANSREKKYRRGARACPECGAATIKRSKYPPRDAAKGTLPGWYCHDKSGGCGLNFPADDHRILESGATSDPAESCDQINTLQKVAQKRSLVAATLIATNASEFFTQDVEDMDVTREGQDIVEGEVVERQQQRQPQQGGKTGRQVVNTETGEVKTEDQPDLTNDVVFVAAWHRTLKGRGWTFDEGETALKGILDKYKKSLGQLNLNGRRELLLKADEGRYDPSRDAMRLKAKQQEQQGGGDAKPQPAAESKPEAAKKPAATMTPAQAEAEVESWDAFLQLARAAAAESVGADLFDRGIRMALMKIAKSGKGETTMRTWRAQQLAAIRASAFNFETGLINQVAEALA